LGECEGIDNKRYPISKYPRLYYIQRVYYNIVVLFINRVKTSPGTLALAMSIFNSDQIWYFLDFKMNSRNILKNRYYSLSPPASPEEFSSQNKLFFKPYYANFNVSGRRVSWVVTHADLQIHHNFLLAIKVYNIRYKCLITFVHTACATYNLL